MQELKDTGTKVFSVHEVYNKCVEKTAQIARQAQHDQSMNIQYANCTPAEFAWPLVATF
jgi:hypothetical protein